MRASCPICRTPVDVDDATIGPDGAKVQCSLCDEVFTVRAGDVPAPPRAGATSSSEAADGGESDDPLAGLLGDGDDAGGGTSSASSSAASASRRLLQEDSGDGLPPRVLVAHDSHSFTQIMRDLLVEEGFDVEIVFDGEAAAERMLSRPPGVAILEAGLPKRYGFQLCAEMRSKAPTAATRFLLIASIYDRKRFGRQTAGAAAPDEFVEPRNIEIELVPKVRKLLKREGTSSRAVSIASASAAPAAAPVAPPGDTSSKFDLSEILDDAGEESRSERSASRPYVPPSAPPNVPDVDAILSSASQPGVSPEPALEMPMSEPSEDSDELLGKLGDDEPIAGDGDDLLKSLMSIAKSDGDPSSEADDGLDAISFSEPSQAVIPAPPPGKKSDESKVIDDFDAALGLSDDEPMPMIQRPGRAPAAGPLDLPSQGSIPDSWKPDGDDAPPKLDEDPLDALLRDDPPATRASMPSPDPPTRASNPGSDLLTADELMGEESKRSSSMELGGIFESQEFPTSARPKSVLEEDPATLLQEGFSDPGGRRSGSGPVPSSSGGDPPTVLRSKTGSAPRPSPAPKDPLDEILGASRPSTTDKNLAFADDEDDEKSLPEARAAKPGSDDDADAIDRLLADDFKPGVADRETEDSPRKSGPKPAPVPSKDAEHEKARRIAKLVVSDILLYNADRIADAVKSGNFFEVMKGDIKDGRDYFDEKVPPEVRAERDYIKEALDEVIAAKKKELGLA